MKDTTTKRRGLLALCAVLLTGALVLAGCNDLNNGDDGVTATIKLSPVETNKFTLTLTGATWTSNEVMLAMLQQHSAAIDDLTFMAIMESIDFSFYSVNLTVTRTSDTVLTCIFSKIEGLDSALAGTVRLNPTFWEKQAPSYYSGTYGGIFLYHYTNEGDLEDYIYKGTLTPTADSGT